MEPNPQVCLDVGQEIKTQEVRLWDVFVIGPLMMWGGKALAERGHGVAGPLLTVLGGATVYYNGRNYFRVRRRLREQGSIR